MASTLMSGAQMLLECLAREGVDCIFGYPGGVTLPFYDVLYDHHIRHIYDKIDVSSRAEAVRFAVHHQILAATGS